MHKCKCKIDGSPPFKKGRTSADFHAQGITLEVKLKLKIEVMGSIIRSDEKKKVLFYQTLLIFLNPNFYRTL